MSLEFDERFAQSAREACSANGVHNVEVLSEAAEVIIPKLCPAIPFDIVFIDADRLGYLGYLKAMLQASMPGDETRLLRPGAIIISDNVLRSGSVPDENYKAAYDDRPIPPEQAAALREFNDFCLSHPRLETFMLPLWDGVSMTRLLD